VSERKEGNSGVRDGTIAAVETGKKKKKKKTLKEKRAASQGRRLGRVAPEDGVPDVRSPCSLSATHRHSQKSFAQPELL